MKNQEFKLSKLKIPVVELITEYGYPVEVYDDIITEDGYILTSYRIPHGRTNKTDSPKPVVMLMHGMASNSADFLVPGPQRGLAFVLSDTGYDVWLPNSRGKTASRRHLNLNPAKDDYWKFTYHELGFYDLPAFLNRIEKITGLRTIAYIGQSLGTILPFVLLSERVEFNKRFNLIIAFNPALMVSNAKSIPYRFLNVTMNIWMPFMEITGNLEWPPRFFTDWIFFLNSTFFGTNRYFQNLIAEILYMLHGKTPEQLIKADIPIMLQYYPDATSALVLKHCAQNYNIGGIFRKFDYGHKRNLEEYGRPDPPLYDLNKVRSPVVMFCSSGDLVIHPKDAHVLGNHLPNCVAIHDIEDPKFSHSDFLYGKYAAQIIHPVVIEHLKTYCQIK